MNRCPAGSCEFLLKPKEIMRAASDTCCHTTTSGDKSNSTVTSSNMPCNTKCSGRSQSLSVVGCEKSVLRNSDMVPPAVQDCRNCKDQAPTKQRHTKLPKSMCAYPQEQGPSKEDALIQPVKVCTCLQEKVDKTNSSVTSSNLSCKTKCSGRSQSLSGVGCEKSVLKHSNMAPAVQDCPNCKDQAPTKQRRTKLPKSMCACPQDPSKEDALNQSVMVCECLQEKVAKVVKVPLNEPNTSNKPGPLCNCLQEKKAVILPTKEEDPTNQPIPLQKEILKVGTVMLKEQDVTNELGPCCKCLQETITEVVKVPSKEHDSTNQLKTLPENVLKVPSKVQDSTNQLRSLQENELKVPSKVQNPTSQLKPLRENELIVLSKIQNHTSQLKPLQENGLKVPSKVHYPTDQLGLCCRCNLEKIPKSVQVPSQSRAVEESSQYPEEKIVSVHEKTQYEPTPEASRSTQNLAPCCCKTCNKLIPSPAQLLCIPVKASPQMCLTIAPAQVVAPKKQKARRLSVSCQNGEAIKCKGNSQNQHQPEPSACSKDTALNQNNCHEFNQVFGPIPILRQSYSTVAINEEKGEYSILKEVSVVKKFTHAVTCASSDAAQTSDHSIRFEKDACDPLFFKIICPDVSKNE